MTTKPALAGLLLLAAAAGVPSSATAQQLPDPMAMTTDAADRAVLPDVARAIGSGKPDKAALDALLLRLPRPTPLRGMIQTIRAGVLYGDDDMGGATGAIEEALRLLPDDPRPKMVATLIFTFNGAPQRAADVWLQASRISPELARSSDRYLMMALVGRLTDVGDRARADRVTARLGEIGFSAALAPERSDAALARVREAMRAGDQSAALRDVTAIGNPNDLLSLYIDSSYAPLWPRIAEWAGDDLAQQQRRYLEELRSDWQAGDDLETAVPYARQLSNIRAYDAVVALFLPLLDKVPAGSPAASTEFLTPVVARALYMQGRHDEAMALLARVDAAYSDRKNANTLNIAGSYVTLSTFDLKWAEVIARADTFIARAKTMGYSVNSSATVQVQAWRACALSHTGRTAEAQDATNEIIRVARQLPGVAMNLLICRGDADQARSLLVTFLNADATRDVALRYLQPTDGVQETAFDRMIAPTMEALRTAPEVRAAAEKVGRILPAPVLQTMPRGFDPYRLAPSQRVKGAATT